MFLILIYLGDLCALCGEKNFMSELIRVEHLVKIYFLGEVQVPALMGVDLTIQAGEGYLLQSGVYGQIEAISLIRRVLYIFNQLEGPGILKSLKQVLIEGFFHS